MSLRNCTNGLSSNILLQYICALNSNYISRWFSFTVRVISCHFGWWGGWWCYLLSDICLFYGWPNNSLQTTTYRWTPNMCITDMTIWNNICILKYCFCNDQLDEIRDDACCIVCGGRSYVRSSLIDRGNAGNRNL